MGIPTSDRAWWMVFRRRRGACSVVARICAPTLARRVIVTLGVAILAPVVAEVTLAAPTPSEPASAGATFRVKFESSVRAEPATGRLVVYLISGKPAVGARRTPADGPFFRNPQPMYGADVSRLHPGDVAVIDDTATSFPTKLSELPPGAYQAQAVLDITRRNSRWEREPGNLYSEVVSFTLNGSKGRQVIDLALTKRVNKRLNYASPGVAIFQVRSRLLSDFRGRDVVLRAGVVLPIKRDTTRAYPAVYIIPGFGGDYGSAGRLGFAARRAADSATGVLARNVFSITLDPEGPNGHHLFADSANNGPVGKALVTELIPALEREYGLISEASARLLRGHSSGGWSSLWLALTYPEVFGACWSSSPDPVDFRRFQYGGIYDGGNFYERVGGGAAPSYRRGRDGKVRMTVRQENRMEEVLGPDNTSGQQWDSWFAVFGPRNAAGHPTALFNPATGVIDRGVAEDYRKYDIADRLRRNPTRYAPIFRSRVRLLVGDRDNFYLNEAVQLLKLSLDAIPNSRDSSRDVGYVTIVHGANHGSIFRSPEAEAIPGEMLGHLRRFGHIPK